MGSDRQHGLQKDLESQGGGQSIGVPASGEVEGNAYSPLGSPGVQHWQATYIDRDGLNDRGNVFFAAVEMTRMPMVVTDPRQHDNPIVFANGAFFDLTGYARADVLGRNCRFLQGAQTDPRTVDEVRRALQEQRAVAVDIMNYKADGTPFWNALFIGPTFDQVAENVLAMAGYAVQSAASGEQALELVDQGTPVDLLFTDVIMPGGMNGLELVEKLRQLRPKLPVLVTTGYMDELPARERGRGLDILAKPYRHEDLLERVKAALGTAA